MSITRRFNIKLPEPNFYEVESSENPARVTLTLEDTEDKSLGTHYIKLNDREILHVGNWKFRPETLFCDYNEGVVRIEISATNLCDGTQYNFYMADNVPLEDNESLLLDYVMTLIVAIACADSIDDFDNKNKGTNIGRFKNRKI